MARSTTRSVWRQSAFFAYRAIPRQRHAEFLRQIANNLERCGEHLVERVVEETALLLGRVRAERDRTCFQLRFFAGIVEEGSLWMRELTPVVLIASRCQRPMSDRCGGR
jgi:NADP-dependent aldehyde dehydrogenase